MKWCTMIKVDSFVKQYTSTRVEIPRCIFDAKVTLLLGENGSGKTTLLKAMAHLIKYEGVIKREKQVIYAPEKFVYPEHMRVKSYLQMILKLGEGTRVRLDWLIRHFDMEVHQDKCFKELSKGMKQKVNLIQTLMEPRGVYCLDEPLNGLDTQSKEQFMALVKSCEQQFICATHDAEAFKGVTVKKVVLW